MTTALTFRCQSCGNPLEFSGVTENALQDVAHSVFAAASTSVRIDGSFIVVPETTPARPRTVPAASAASPIASTPPLPPVETRSSDTPSSSGRVKVHTERVSSPQKTAYGSTFGDSDYVPNPSARQASAQGPHTGPAASRTMEESFVVLPWSAGASVMQGPPGAQSQQAGPSGGAQGAAHSNRGTPQAGPAPRAPSFDHRVQALARLCDMASDETKIDHPMCRDCTAQLRDEIESQIAEAEAECAAYEEALERITAEAADGAASCPSKEAFAAEMASLLAAEAAEMAAADAAAALLRDAEAELARLTAATEEMDAMEARFWHDYNDFQLQLLRYVDDRDALLARIAHATEQREELRKTNVFNDAFHIWHDGPFGTINGLRLGRTGAVPVEWDEINAAWGQAVLLLATMGRICRFTFSTYALLPMGSSPRVRDSARGATYDLFGPVNSVNVFASQRYDKAICGFLACLQEFADFAHAKDVSNGVAKPFEMSYKIDGDKVDGRSVRFTLNRDEKWTQALKLMLTDLKLALAWLSSATLD